MQCKKIMSAYPGILQYYLSFGFELRSQIFSWYKPVRIFWLHKSPDLNTLAKHREKITQASFRYRIMRYVSKTCPSDVWTSWKWVMTVRNRGGSLQGNSPLGWSYSVCLNLSAAYLYRVAGNPGPQSFI